MVMLLSSLFVDAPAEGLVGLSVERMSDVVKLPVVALSNTGEKKFPLKIALR